MKLPIDSMLINANNSSEFSSSQSNNTNTRNKEETNEFSSLIDKLKTSFMHWITRPNDEQAQPVLASNEHSSVLHKSNTSSPSLKDPGIVKEMHEMSTYEVVSE